MKGKYTRLKVKMLCLVILGAGVAGALGFLLIEYVAEGILQNMATHIFVWGATTFFGQSETRGLALYQSYVSDNRQMILLLGAMVMMLVAFYVAMGRFTRWLDEISQATRRVVEETGESVALSRELTPIAMDLEAIQNQLMIREEEMRDSERRRNELVAFLAHDLKTPLTSVVGYLTLLKDEPILNPEDRDKYTGIALEKAQRLQELLGEFFDITTMDLDTSVAEVVPVQLTMLLEQLVDEFYPLFGEKQLACVADIAPNLVVLGEADKLVRVFDNVLRNAVSYSIPGGEVVLTARINQGMVEIAVDNEGLEIPAEELSNIFQKFYRLDAARSTRTGGAGLGLAIAKEILTGHGGSIWCQSNGRLTSFIMTLPPWTVSALGKWGS